MRAIAVASHKRMPLLPDVPTLAESGFPDFEDRSWIAFFAPAGTPAPAVTFLNDEINAALRRPDVRERFATIGLDAQTMAPREFADYVKSEIAKWGRIIEATGIKPD